MRMFSMQSRRLRRTSQPRNGSKFIIFALFSLVAFWSICFVVWATKTSSWNKYASKNSQEGSKQQQQSDRLVSLPDKSFLRERSLEPHILSRSGSVNATADVRGNLGPAQVVVQPHPGKDWLHDRWQAASNMHGKNIPGAHWIHLDFGMEIIPQKIVLDWEAAYADEYRLEGSLFPISSGTTTTTTDKNNDDVWILFDASDPNQKSYRSVEQKGQSPGVKTKTPLHVIHTLYPLQSNQPLRYIRLYILKSAMGWGVSLWQFDVYGFYPKEVME